MQERKQTPRMRAHAGFGLFVAATLSLTAACGDEQEPLNQNQGGAQGGDGDGDGDGNPTPAADSKWCDALAALRTNCQECHSVNAQSPAPMPLDTYEDLLKPGITNPNKKIYELVAERIHDARRPMPEPPRVMSEADKAAIDAWIAAGAQPGSDPSCSSTPPSTGNNNGGTGGNTDGPGVQPGPKNEEWPEDCEEIYSIRVGVGDQPHTVRAGTETHPQFYFDAPWGDDEVQALAFKPITDNKKVLHHWILYENGGGGLAGGSFLTGWAPGKDELRTMPPDIGVWMPSGKRALRLDTHYYNLGNSQDELDKSGVDVCITRTFREHTAGTYPFGTLAIELEPGKKTDVTATCNVTTPNGPVYLLSSSPHMHKLGYWAQLYRTRAGEQLMLHDQSFNFEFQDVKPLDRVELKTGDVVTTVCKYENTTSGRVRFGQDTDDEMCFNFALYYPRNGLRCRLGILGF
jgi:mono/diheme cytochrome c family protein